MLQATKDLEERRKQYLRNKKKHKRRQERKRELLPREWLNMSRCGQWPPYLFCPKGVGLVRNDQLFFGRFLNDLLHHHVVFPETIAENGFQIPDWMVRDSMCSVIRTMMDSITMMNPFSCLHTHSLKSLLSGSFKVL